MRTAPKRALATVVAVTASAALLLAGPAAAARVGGADQGGAPLDATLTGDAEVPGPGDSDGSGEAHVSVNRGQQVVCFELEARDIEPATAAHIHRGTADVAGPVVVTLAPPTDGSASGCVQDVDPDLLEELLETPEAFYVNVHNEDFPAGALRGQLTRPGR